VREWRNNDPNYGVGKRVRAGREENVTRSEEAEGSLEMKDAMKKPPRKKDVARNRAKANVTLY